MDTKKIKRGKSVAHKFLLTGLIKCKNCGRNYFGTTYKTRTDYYKCSGKRNKSVNCTSKNIRVDYLDSFIWLTFFQNGTMYERVKEAFKEGGQKDKRNKAVKKSKNLENQIESIRKKITDNYLAFNDNLVDESNYLLVKKRRENEQHSLNEQLEAIAKEIELLENESRVLSDILTDFKIPNQLRGKDTFVIEGLKTILESKQKEFHQKEIAQGMPISEKKQLLKKYIERITLDYDKEKQYFILTTEFKLPIPQETHILDKSYKLAGNKNTSKVIALKNLTEREYMDFRHLLRSYITN